MLRRTLRSLFVLAVVAGLASGSLAQTLTIAQGTDPQSLDAHIPTRLAVRHGHEPHLRDALPLGRRDGPDRPALGHGRHDVGRRPGVDGHAARGRDVPQRHAAQRRGRQGEHRAGLDPATGAIRRFLLNRIQSMEVVDEFTIEFTLAAPFAPFLSHLTHSGVAIVHPDVVAEYGEATTPSRSARVPSASRAGSAEPRRPRALRELLGHPAGDRAPRLLDGSRGTTRAAMIESGEADVPRAFPRRTSRA
jgi:hypothetical protein